MKRFMMLGAIALFTTAALAQDKGMHFEHELSWNQVLTKAKAEHKLIMVDCYTTWCGPCKVMAKRTFTDEKVGTFYNKHFINVKMQFDTTKNDSKEVKAGYADAKYINTKYNIEAYPTLLFFDGDGNLVDKRLGYMGPDEFLAAGESAVNPAERLDALVATFNKDRKNKKAIEALAGRMKELDEETEKAVYDAYLAIDAGKLTPEKTMFVLQNTHFIADKGFELMRKNGKIIDSVAGKGATKEAIIQVLMNEYLMPVFMESKGEVSKIDWVRPKNELEQQYPEYTEDVIMRGKLFVILKTQSPEIRADQLDQFIPAYKNKPGFAEFAMPLSGLAYEVCSTSNDTNLLKRALNWSETLLTIQDVPEEQKIFLKQTYAYLLYKNGRGAEAIKEEEAILERAKKAGETENVKRETKIIERMKKGVKDPRAE